MILTLLKPKQIIKKSGPLVKCVGLCNISRLIKKKYEVDPIGHGVRIYSI